MCVGVRSSTLIFLAVLSGNLYQILFFYQKTGKHIFWCIEINEINRIFNLSEQLPINPKEIFFRATTHRQVYV